jgi:hypothetical protein
MIILLRTAEEKTGETKGCSTPIIGNLTIHRSAARASTKDSKILEKKKSFRILQKGIRKCLIFEDSMKCKKLDKKTWIRTRNQQKALIQTRI